MARIRSIHPGIWTDESFVSVSSYARLLAIGLWNECDDGGAFEWKPLQLKMRLMPIDNVDVVVLLAELVTADVIASYEGQDGKLYGAVRNFGRWQRPKQPARRHPMPAKLLIYTATTEISVPKVATETPSAPAISEKSGNEGTSTPAISPKSGNEESSAGLEPPAFPPKAEMSAQMEDGGDKRKEEGEKERVPTTSDAKAASADQPEPPLPILDVLWRDGVPIIRSLIGLSDSKSRAFLGRLRQVSGDDCARLYGLLREAESLKPADPRAWLVAAAGRTTTPYRAREPPTRKLAYLDKLNLIAPGFDLEATADGDSAYNAA